MGLQNRRFRSALSLVVALVLVFSIGYLGIHTYQASHAATGASIYATPDSATLASGSTLSITIRENSGTDPVNSVQATLGYDSSALQYVSMSEGGTFPVMAATSVSTPGLVRIARAAPDDSVTGDKPIVTLNFKVIGSGVTSKITFDKAYSFLVRSSDSKDILENVGAGTFAISPSTPPVVPTNPGSSSSTKPTLAITPVSGTYAPGSTIGATIVLRSGTTATTTVEATVSYPASQLQYLSVSEGSGFVVKQRTASSSGLIDIIRGVSGGSSGLQNDTVVVTLSFKVLDTSGTVPLSFTNASAAYDSSGSGTNILDLANSTGARYTVSTSAPTQPGTSSNSTTSTSVTSPAQAVTIRSSVSKGSVSLTTLSSGAVLAELSGQVDLQPMIDQSVYANNARYKINQVDYYLDNKLISSQKTKPYSYKLDTSSIRNGSHTLIIRTYYSNGAVDSRTDSLLIKNKITFKYVAAQYKYNILTVVGVGLLLAVIMWKFILPRSGSRRAAAASYGPDHDVLYGFGTPIAGPIAEDSMVVAPTSKAKDTVMTVPDESQSVIVAPSTASPAPSVSQQPSPAPGPVQPSVKQVVSSRPMMSIPDQIQPTEDSGDPSDVPSTAPSTNVSFPSDHRSQPPSSAPTTQLPTQL